MSITSSTTATEPAAYADFINSVLVVNGTTICITDFEYEEKTDKHDVSGTCSNGKRNYQAGLKGADFNGKGFVDLAHSPFTVFGSGSAANVTWSANGSAVNFSSAKCIMDSVKVTGNMQDGVITFTFSGSAGDDYTVA